VSFFYSCIASGKTHFTFRLIKARAEMFTHDFCEVIYCLPPGHEIEIDEELTSDRRFSVFRRGIPEKSRFRDKRHRLVIFDDQMNDINEQMSEFFTKNSHHLNVTCVFLTQNLFFANRHNRTMSLNTNYFVLRKHARAADQIAHIARQVYGKRSRILTESYSDACKQPYSYVVVDLTQSCSELHRIRTNIFPDDNHSTVIYAPRI
jgi:hypothetical protein